MHRWAGGQPAQPNDDRGLQALQEYARTPVAFTPLKSDPLLRLLICDLVGEEVTRRSMATLRDDIADIKSRLEDAERTAHQLPHREKYLLLVTSFMRRFLELHQQLVAEVEQELSGEAVIAPPGSAETLRVGGHSPAVARTHTERSTSPPERPIRRKR